jgi:signal transduction histidine kinase/CheY-like chemotaxis protein/urease gamma subunit
MKTSIKIQISLFLLAFVLLLSAQLYFAQNNQTTFKNALTEYQSTVNEEKLMRELERDVLNLQRQVLIFLDTGSQSAIKRFDGLMLNVKETLAQVDETLPENHRDENTAATLLAMAQHLNDYDENFVNVVKERQQRDAYFDEGLLSSIQETLYKQTVIISPLLQNTFRYELTKAQNVAFQYLLSPSTQLKDEFSLYTSNVLSAVEKSDMAESLKADISAQIHKIDSQFRQLTQTTNGYIYLVNVVMAGNANEFLYLTQELSGQAAEYAFSTQTDISETLNDLQARTNIYSIFALVIALAIAMFVVKRVLTPIERITNIFERLVAGKDVNNIPYSRRKDEIGKMAIAAESFKQSNQQTETLLREARELNHQQIKLNKELSEAKLLAERANAAKSMFLANMSHEIRTPMNGIVGLLDVVLTQDIPEDVRSKLDKVAYSSQILMSVINDILDFSKIEAGKLVIEELSFSFSSLFNSLLAVCSIRAAEKNLNLELYVDPSLPATAIGDHLRISQVILNLCSNALKFTDHGKVGIYFTKHPTDSPAQFYLQIKVVDSGVGMSQSQLDNVFKPFEQADGSTSRQFGGTGLGLAIVKQLTELMQGSVEMVSEEGKGSEISCRFLLSYENESEALYDETFDANKDIFYISESSKPLLDEKLLPKLGSKTRWIDTEQLKPEIQNMSQTEKENTRVVFDVESGRDSRNLMPIIEFLFKHQIGYGAVTNTQPLHLKDMLETQWHCPILSHPFTPVEYSSFVRHLYSMKNVHPKTKSTEKIAIKVKQEQQTETFSGHVLLVEDNGINQVVAGEMLRSLGLTFDIAEDGQQACIKLSNSSDYDLILMDIQMPVMDGKEATKRIRQEGNKDIPIIGLSANAMKQDFEKAIESGMNEYLTKPIKRSDLLHTLKKYF